MSPTSSGSSRRARSRRARRRRSTRARFAPRRPCAVRAGTEKAQRGRSGENTSAPRVPGNGRAALGFYGATPSPTVARLFLSETENVPSRTVIKRARRRLYFLLIQTNLVIEGASGGGRALCETPLEGGSRTWQKAKARAIPAWWRSS